MDTVRTPVSELLSFYDTPLGALVSEIVTAKLVQAWGRADGCRVVGFGHAAPFLGGFTGAERRAAFVPEGMGAVAGGEVPTVLVRDHEWPLPDASVDRLLIFHGLEEVAGPRRLLREAWRVLSDDGALIVGAANRRGPWSMIETSPFAAGRPFSRRQLDELLRGSLLEPTAHATALHFPPIPRGGILSLARAWERLGNTIEGWRLPLLLPNLAGINFVEARKATALPVGGSKVEAFLPRVLGQAGLEPATSRHRRDKTNNAASAQKLAKPGD